MVGERADISVADDRNVAREGDRVAGSARTRMGEVHHHAAVVDFADTDAAEFGQPGVVQLQRAASNRALLVIHDLYDALSEPCHNQDQARIALYLGCQPLTPEDDSESPLASSATNVVGFKDVEQTRLKIEVAQIAMDGVQIGA